MELHDIKRDAMVRLRKRLRIPQVEIARAVAVDRSTYCLWENGYKAFPEERLNAIASFLAVQVDALKQTITAAPTERSEATDSGELLQEAANG